MTNPSGDMAASGARSRVAFWLACATAAAIFPLVFVGAGVTSKDAGMVFPDGFTANGYFLQNPPGWWDHDHMRWEHGHRLLGRAVGVLAIALCVASWASRGVLRRMALATLAAIVIQGVMGALRVERVSTLLAMIHGVWGQLCFCLACVTALVASSAWSGRRPVEVPAGTLLRRLSVATMLAIVVQLILGAALRHFSSSAALVGHILWAVVVALMAGWLALWIIGQFSVRGPVGFFGWSLGLLTALQVLLGGLAWIATQTGMAGSGPFVWIAPTLHTAVGALVLVCAVLLAASLSRFTRNANDVVNAGARTGMVVAS